jgi:acyl carrier protein
MKLNDFVKNFASQFDETDSSAFSPETKFKDLGEWSSLLALSIIAMVDEEYEVKIKGDDIRNSSTLEDLFTVVKSRI